DVEAEMVEHGPGAESLQHLDELQLHRTANPCTRSVDACRGTEAHRVPRAPSTFNFIALPTRVCVRSMRAGELRRTVFHAPRRRSTSSHCRPVYASARCVRANCGERCPARHGGVNLHRTAVPVIARRSFASR